MSWLRVKQMAQFPCLGGSASYDHLCHLCGFCGAKESKSLKLETISLLHRKLLHRLLHRELGQCSSSALLSAQRRGWVYGLAGGYELTDRGRQVAELSERADPRGPLKVPGLETPALDYTGPIAGGFGDRSGKGTTGGQFHVQSRG